MVSDSITRHLANYSMSIKLGSTIVNGKVTPSYSTTTKSLAIFPLTHKMLKYLPEGFYTTQDVKIFEIGAATLKEFDRVTYKGKIYEINNPVDRSVEGGFCSYLAKRLEK